MSRNHLFVQHGQTYLNKFPFLVKGLRCSNALISDFSTDQLIRHLPVFAEYGVNTVSVFIMGSRFGDIKGYCPDGTLDSQYTKRLGRILDAADKLSMVVLVGCLYWGNSLAKYQTWTQQEANTAIASTVLWLAKSNHYNVIVDVDNEGMALRNKGFDNRAMVIAGKDVNSAIIIGTNYKGDPPPEADIALHFSNNVQGKPYVESEGSPSNTPGGYWGPYSKREPYYGYLNVGVYTEVMKQNQINLTRQHLDQGKGYLLASTWLQAATPQGPNHFPGGYGRAHDPGIRWWLSFLQSEYGRYPCT